jgi:hypothetical protein
MSTFKVSVSSKFEELWRYNIVLVCEVCNDKGERLDYLSEESYVAPVGSNLNAAPIDYSVDRTLRISTKEGDYLNILVYIIPHTLPSTNDIIKTKPFSLVVKVENDKKENLINQAFKINQWSGDNIALNKVGVTE